MDLNGLLLNGLIMAILLPAKHLFFSVMLGCTCGRNFQKCNNAQKVGNNITCKLSVNATNFATSFGDRKFRCWIHLLQGCGWGMGGVAYRGSLVRMWNWISRVTSRDLIVKVTKWWRQKWCIYAWQEAFKGDLVVKQCSNKECLNLWGYLSLTSRRLTSCQV